MVNIIANNGIEYQNESSKYQYLKDHNNNSPTGMITVMNQEILHNKYQSHGKLSSVNNESTLKGAAF
ncbi:hypothetical protein pdam_00025050, partial [Pocillopora damicornis]